MQRRLVVLIQRGRSSKFFTAGCVYVFTCVRVHDIKFELKCS